MQKLRITDRKKLVELIERIPVQNIISMEVETYTGSYLEGINWDVLKYVYNVDNSTVAKFATVQIEGGREVERNIEYYSLDVIISVGYRVKSKRGVEFRRWANSVLKQYILKGYIGNIYQSFGGVEICESLEEKLPTSLYFPECFRYNKE